MLKRLARRTAAIAFCAALVLGLGWGCGSSTTSKPRNSTTGSGGATDASNQGDRTVKLDGDQTDSGALKLNPLCGVAVSDSCEDGGSALCTSSQTPYCDKTTQRCRACIPDQRDACMGYLPPSNTGGAGGQAGESGMSEAGAAAEAGTSDSDAGSDNPAFGCQITTDPTSAEPVAACAPSGHGGVDAPCNSSADCQAHLACVTSASTSGGNGASNIPLCRPFCCEGDAVCGSGTYCAERALHDDRAASPDPDASSAAQVPVCIPADDCDLATPYPCPNGTDCLCKGNTACTVVRSGTTACVVPGKGQEFEPCPCAFGYVCSADTNACLKLCLVGGEQSCGQGLCQSVAGLPQGWGVCIGDTHPG